jgi:hypothetical protein
MESGNVVAQVPVTESEGDCTSDSDSVPFPRRASEIGPDQLLATPPVTGPVEEFAVHATRAAVPTITSTRCIFRGGLSAMITFVLQMVPASVALDPSVPRHE